MKVNVGERSMVTDTLDEKAVQRFYDWLGARHDWVEFFEGKAKHQAYEQLKLRPGQRVLNAGCGTGRDHGRLVDAVGSEGLAVGLDLSRVMASLTQTRTSAPTCLGRVSQLPFPAEAFDCLLCTYVLDVIPTRLLASIAADFHRVLRTGGRAVVVTLGAGLKPPATSVGWLWERLYVRAPLAFGGCRPVHFYSWLREAGFRQVMWEPVVQLGIPSEMVIADK